LYLSLCLLNYYSMCLRPSMTQCVCVCVCLRYICSCQTHPPFNVSEVSRYPNEIKIHCIHSDVCYMCKNKYLQDNVHSTQLIVCRSRQQVKFIHSITKDSFRASPQTAENSDMKVSSRFVCSVL